ncbi:MAG: hypothetical protein IKE74_04535 [Mogibacterium sp.]|nr:hypothetical protein [Mogibacterium sp.]
MKKQVVIEEKRIAFIIWTPLHLFNSVRFILSRNMVGECDAFYICQSKGMKMYYEGVLQKGIFKDVYYTTSEMLGKHQHLWEISSGLFMPTLYVRHIFGRGSTGKKYNQVFMSVPTRLNEAIIRSNYCDEVIGYDDGTGSYISNLYDCSLGRKYELIKKVINIPPHRVAKAYVNNPEIIIQDNGMLHEKLLARELTDEERLQIKNVFGYIDDDDLTPYIYLNQPLKEIMYCQDYMQTEKKIIEMLAKELGPELSVRMHPRENDKNHYKGLTINDNTQMWEIICSEESIDDKVLISSFSTAQFTPKLFFNKEPWVVFTIKAYKDYCDKQTIINAEKLIDLLREKYEKKKRVISVNNIAELEKILHEIKDLH